ncbi:MAG: ATP-dependent DNA ligase [Candidatus Micrarchaeota archaeon]
MLLFRDVADVFSKIESISGRLEMTDILAELFKKTKSNEIDKLVYLTQGILSPPYEGINLGLGERFAIAAVASSSGYDPKKVEENYKKSGDLGLTAEELISKKKQQSLSSVNMSISYIYNSLVKIALISGSGSQDLKIKYLTELLNNSTPLEARFIIRFVTGTLRLGVGDPTIIDAFSVSKTGDKSLREELERAYNVCCDLGYVAKTFFETPEKIKKFEVTPFKPLMPALAERLSTPSEIFEKLGECAIELKFDGFRLQCHKKGDKVEIYSRKLEKMTHMFPDVTNAIKQLSVNEIIFEGEALAYDEKRHRYFSFQQTMQRRRKHNIKEASVDLPLNIFCFDILYLNGKDYTSESYGARRRKLEELFPKGILKLSEKHMVKSGDEIKKLFEKSIRDGLEGIMAKDLSSPYTAGKRKFAWIKMKKSYGVSVDTIDAVIVGYYLGKGSRAEFEFGGLLVAVKNTDNQKLQTIAKIGSGFTEEQMKELQTVLEKASTKSPPRDLEYKIDSPDFWVKPKYVVEIAFDDITMSSIHTCGVSGERGYALRFPRMVKLRDDKGINEVTTASEVEEMFERQKK